MSATVDAASHLGKDYLENLHSTKNQSQRAIKHVFDATKKFITDQTQIQYQRLIGAHTFLAQDNFVNRQKQSKYQQQKSTYSPIPYCVWAR